MKKLKNLYQTNKKKDLSRLMNIHDINIYNHPLNVENIEY